MENISKIRNCYGCGVCAIACPSHIINIELNKEGFFQPKISNIDKCTDCGVCLSVCAYTHEKLSLDDNKRIDGYAAWSNNEDVRYKCSSGGIGFETGKHLLTEGYKVCGVKYNIEKQRAEHFIADNEKDFEASIGSKYIQSYTVDAFSNFSKDEKYFVSGTPCQIDSLRRYIRGKKIESNFVLMDFFCHGVPSHLMWKKYLKSIENRIEEFTELSWRNKKTGWHDSWAITAKSNERTYFSLFSKGDLFYKMFLNDSCLGKACYEKCKYKGIASSADMRIGDLWGPTYKDEEKGVSGVLAITEKGRQIVEMLQPKLTLIFEDISVVTEGQMKRSPSKPILYGIYMWMLRSSSVTLSVEVKLIDMRKMISHHLKLLMHPVQAFKKIKTRL